MDATYSSYQTRLATFAAAATTTKTRRTSNRSKKAAPKAASKAKAAWPLSSPAPEDLAFAGFVWKPTTASLDNVQCFNCNCQLDGWDESDVPAYEHLTHSPNCGFAIVTCIRLRNGDPSRTEDDPTSDKMVLARQETFGDAWPLDPATGFPSVDQMVAAGWVYDPTEGNPDGVTCPYCALSLDAWDQGDDPLEEHSRRSSDCLFFALKDLYHPAPTAKKGKRASTKATSTKATSTKAKRASTRSSTASTTAKKPRAAKATKKSRSSKVSTTQETVPSPQPRHSSPASNIQETTLSQHPLRSSPPSHTQETTLPQKPLHSSPVYTTLENTRGSKRASEAMEESDEYLQPSKRMRSFSMSSLPEGLLVGTPKRTPPNERSELAWKPIDMEIFNAQEITGLINDVLIDAGLDEIPTSGLNSEDLHSMVLSKLTDQEKEMTIEKWVLYNAQRGAEKLRMSCEQQILAFEEEGRRALALLEGIPSL